MIQYQLIKHAPASTKVQHWQRLHHDDLATWGSPAQLILVLMEHHGTNVWRGCSVKHPGVSVYPMTTAGMLPPGKADIPQSRAVQLPAYNNTASLDMHPIPRQERLVENTRNTPLKDNKEAD